ncbi:nucleic acid-binding protein [Morchella conica CCBAS932]|uniref:Nucleic acid-binding protein n=1 Tax=Morchella conica CCBAS932 TaxID=1392247 RepID=A0A3N4KQD7_9PEZI|nr:nucleic acid-binding protein [Morchella conica CCBAS932]
MFDNGTEDVRFYKEKFPQPGDCVVVIVGKSTKDGVRVKLLEYGHIDGFIRKEDIDRCKETFVLLIARKGKNEVVKVLSVNAETGYTELSKLQVTDDEHKTCDDKYHRAVTADWVLRSVSNQTEKVSVVQLYEDIGWPLVETYGSLNDQVWQPFTFPSPEVLSTLIACVNTRISPDPVSLYAEIDVRCNGYGGNDAIKSALFAGEAMGTDIVPIKTRPIAVPLHRIGSERCYDRVMGLETLANAVDAVKEVIERGDGECNLGAVVWRVTSW